MYVVAVSLVGTIFGGGIVSVGVRSIDVLVIVGVLTEVLVGCFVGVAFGGIILVLTEALAGIFDGVVLFGIVVFVEALASDLEDF